MPGNANQTCTNVDDNMNVNSSGRQSRKRFRDVSIWKRNVRKRHSNISGQKLFHIFLSLGDIDKQRHFITKYCLLWPKSQRKGESDRRRFSLHYRLPQENGDTSNIV